MTELIYQTDSYCKQFQAHVTAVNGAHVLFDRTAFFPGGGGQPADLGFVTAPDGRKLELLGYHHNQGETYHTLAEDHGLEVDMEITGTLDWEHRYKIMRTHTALHMLSAIIWRDFDAKVTGGNMKPGEGRLDFELERMEKQIVEAIAPCLAEEVAAARPIRVAILPREEAMQIPDLIRTKINLLPPKITEIRTVEIEGLDLQADGGTHVANTREVGTVTITKYKSKGKNNKRIHIELD